MDPASIGLAFVAGLLSILSPCVLPLVPIVLATAGSKHAYGPAALAAGLALSFTALGLFVATVGFAIGLDAAAFRMAGAVLLALLGLLLLMPGLQARVAAAGGPVSNWAESRMGSLSPEGWSGQFLVGLLLGAVWAPCVGPTLGAASVLAARGEDLGAVALTMLMFGIGAGLPLMLLGFVSREAMGRFRDRLLGAGRTGKLVLGALLVVIAALVITGFDKTLEAAILDVAPEWLVSLTTRY